MESRVIIDCLGRIATYELGVFVFYWKDDYYIAVTQDHVFIVHLTYQTIMSYSEYNGWYFNPHFKYEYNVFIKNEQVEYQYVDSLQDILKSYCNFSMHGEHKIPKELRKDFKEFVKEFFSHE